MSVLTLSLLLASVSAVSVPAGVSRGNGPPAHADPTKIVPTDGAEPGHPFTIIDTGQRRLTDGCKAVFKLGGSETVVDLRTHKPYNTAKDTVPDIGGGEYTVFVRQADGSEFEIGTFTVIAPVSEPTEPTITPTSGVLGASFTITDPVGRMEVDDVCVFYPTTLPGNTFEATVTISADGKTLTGTVPGTLTEDVQHKVSVRDVATDPVGLFDDLDFFVMS